MKGAGIFRFPGIDSGPSLASAMVQSRGFGEVGWRLRWLVLGLLVVWLGASGPSVLQAASPAVQAKASPSAPSAAPLPGVGAAEVLSQVTGIAISPALGVGALGAWRYFHTPSAQRGALGWWCQPWFWLPALGIVALSFLKDAAGPVLPKVLKKPCDVAELFENKFSAVLATGAIVPLAWSLSRLWAPEGGSAFAGSGLAVIDFSPLLGVLTVPLALVAYAAVFLVSHVIQVLILISPFGTVDAALKSLRLALLASVAGTSWIHPGLGAVWSGLIILLCLPLAGWAFRWLVFGQVFAWDLLTFRRYRRVPDGDASRAFLAAPLGSVPRRTYGWLVRGTDGRLSFRHRPWLVLSARQADLPEGRWAIGRGLVHPELLRCEVAGGDEHWTDLLDFPPRYAGHEDVLSRVHGIPEVRDVGLRAVWAWLRRSLSGGGVAGRA